MNSFKINKPQTVFLYNDPTSENPVLTELKDYLTEKLHEVEITIRNDFISHYLKREYINSFAKKLARIKVRDLNNTNFYFEPLNGEIQFEKKLLMDPRMNVHGVLYDGFKLHSLFHKLILDYESDLKTVHIIFTNRLFGTFNEIARKYHARVIICGYPSIISTSGVIEAPAKPREFYKLKQKYALQGQSNIPIEVLKEQFKDRFIDYDDKRLTEVMKGYIMQAVFYHMVGEAFCNNKNCRLFNAHWQHELINAQTNGDEFCKKHDKILKQLKSL